MSSYEGKNLFEVVGSLIPGYKGYREKEMRRDCDRILREAIVKWLTDRNPAIDQAIARCTREARFDLIQPIEEIRRSVDALAQQVKHAARGYSGFFDSMQVKEEDLDRLYRYDLGLRNKAEHFALMLGQLPLAKDIAGVLPEIRQELQEVNETVRSRDSALTEVR